MAAPVTADLGEMYRSADVGAIASLMSRLGNFARNLGPSVYSFKASFMLEYSM